MTSSFPLLNLEAALKLTSFGLPVFPCNGKDKTPCIKEWKEVASTDEYVVRQFFKGYNNAVPGIACGLCGIVTIDCDVKNGQEGTASFHTLCSELGIDLNIISPPVVETPSGGLHYLFRQIPDLPPLGNSRGSLPPDIDVRGVGGYVIGAGACMEDGRGYSLVWGDLANIPYLPGPLYEIISQSKSKARAVANAEAQSVALPNEATDPSRERDYALKALEKECDKVAKASKGARNETLNNAAFAIGTLFQRGGINELEATNALIDAALQAGLERYEINKTIQSGLNAGKSRPRPSLAQQDVQLPLVDFEGLNEAAARLATAPQSLPTVYAPVPAVAQTGEFDGEDETGLEGATQPTESQRAIAAARRWALLDGWPAEKIAARLTKRGAEGATAIAANAVKWAANYQPGKEIKTAGGLRRVTTVKELNQYFVVLKINGQPPCVAYVHDAQPITMPGFRLLTGAAVVVASIDAKGTPKTKQAADFWVSDNRRRMADEVVFTSGNPQPNQFNLWAGYGVRPEQGDCQLIKKHIYEVIAASNYNDYEQFLNLLAWQVQHVGTPSRIIVALFSEMQQTGKSILLEQILLKIWGLSGLKITSQEHAFGKFNDPLRGKAYLFVDEANFAGNKQLADRLKSEATATTITVEGKGLPVMNFPAGLNIFMATNHRNVARVESCDARYWLLEVSDCRAGDHTYFAKLGHEIENGGCEAFLDFLLKRNVSNFKPQRDINRENALQIENKQNSITGSAISWMQECIDDGQLLGAQENGIKDWDKLVSERIRGQQLLNAYRTWFVNVPNNKYQLPVPNNEFWSVITELGFKPMKSNGVSWRVVPDIPTIQNAIDIKVRGGSK